MRYKVSLIILLSIFHIDIFCQKKESFSVESNYNYYYYFLSEYNHNYYNQGFSLLASYIVDKTKVSSGINFSTKNYYSDFENSQTMDTLNKTDYKISYINFPILISYSFCSSEKYKSDIFGGVVFNKIIKYDLTSYYLNKEPIYEKDIDAGQKTGTSLRLGFNISKYISQRLLVSFSSYADFKITLDHIESKPNYHNLPNDRLSVGLKFGIEYIIN